MPELPLAYIRNLEGRHLLLQPHLDDIPFSVGHIVQRELLTPGHYGIWTIFGKEYFNIRCYPHDEDTENILREEERRWFQITGHPGQRLELEEAGYRGVQGVRRLFLTQRYQDSALDYDSLGYGNWGEVVEHIRRLLEPHIDYVWVPAGIGGHCDHLAVRQAVIQLAEESSLRGILFYHELPYSMYSKSMDWSRFSVDGFRQYGTVQCVPSPQDIEEKRSRISIFHSQIDARQSLVLSGETERIAIWLRRLDDERSVS